jgi:hypothetical protein
MLGVANVPTALIPYALADQWRDAVFVSELWEPTGNWMICYGIGTSSINDPSTTAQPWTLFLPVELESLHPDVVSFRVLVCDGDNWILMQDVLLFWGLPAKGSSCGWDK